VPSVHGHLPLGSTEQTTEKKTKSDQVIRPRGPPVGGVGWNVQIHTGKKNRPTVRLPPLSLGRGVGSQCVSVMVGGVEFQRAGGGGPPKLEEPAFCVSQTWMVSWGGKMGPKFTPLAELVSMGHGLCHIIGGAGGTRPKPGLKPTPRD